MTINNALKFLKRGQVDKELRQQLNGAPSAMEINLVLAGEQLTFTPEQMEEAFRMRLVKCQTLEEADILKEFKKWWDLLRNSHGQHSDCGSCASSCGT